MNTIYKFFAKQPLTFHIRRIKSYSGLARSKLRIKFAKANFTISEKTAHIQQNLTLSNRFNNSIGTPLLKFKIQTKKKKKRERTNEFVFTRSFIISN